MVSTKIFSDILEGIKKGHNIKEYKIILKQLIKEIRPTSSEHAKINIEKIWSPLTKQHGLLDHKNGVNNLEKEVKKMFGNRIFKFIFNLPWTLVDRKNIFFAGVSGVTLFLSAFWGISTFIAGEAGSPPVFGSSGFTWWDSFVTNLFRNTQWEQILLIVLIAIFGLWLIFFCISKYVIGNIERVGKKLQIHALPEVLRDTKVFLWKTLINDWVLAEDRKELIQYLESISNVLDNVHDLLADKFLDVEITDDTIFQNRHLEPNPVLEINLNSVSENGIYKDFEGSVSILKSDLISLLERSFDQEWMKIRGAIGRDMVPKRINENFKKSLHEFEKRILNNSILEPKTALTAHGLDKREHIVKNLWSEGDYPREKVLDLLEPEDTNELVHFLKSEEVSLLNAKSDAIVYTRFAPVVLDLPGYSNFIRTKESKVAGVMRLVPMSIQVEYLRIFDPNPLERVM